jgi:pimeloyl-ACP methyl ester carboxylesterase
MTGGPDARGAGAAGWTRRRVLALGLAPAAAVAAAALTGAELISRGILPGQGLLDTLDGACSVPGPAVTFSPPGPSSSRTFYSAVRRRMVGYTIAWPPGHRAGAELPLVVMLHGYGGTHADALVGLSPAQAVALRVDGRPLAPMAIVTVDGGNGYWNSHPGDDPGAMVIGELIPLRRRLGLGRRRIGMLGISMGGYGALLLAEQHPRLIAAVAVISPAIWTSYAQAHAANAGAYASAAAFAADDAVTHASALARIPVRVASGHADPFYPGVQALALSPAFGDAATSAGFMGEDTLALATDIEKIIRSRSTPALLTRTSSRPYAPSAVASSSSPVGHSATSPAATAACPPPARISAATAWTASPGRSLSTSRAPARASASASARPSPLAAPVTTATRPVRVSSSSIPPDPHSARSFIRNDPLSQYPGPASRPPSATNSLPVE